MLSFKFVDFYRATLYSSAVAYILRTAVCVCLSKAAGVLPERLIISPRNQVAFRVLHGLAPPYLNVVRVADLPGRNQLH